MRYLAILAVVYISFLWSCGDSTFENRGADSRLYSLETLRVQDSIRTAIHAKEKSEAIRKLIKGKIDKGFNGNALVVQSGITLLDTASGFANFESKIPLSKSSAFQLASLSKTFTAIAVLKLVDQGKLSLDLTVKDYYPAFPYEGVTIRSLLSHRSGLPYYEYSFDQKVRSGKLHPDNQDIMNWFIEADPAPARYNLPDHYFSYNNTNFAILAALVEKVSKQDFNHFLRDEIFKPLGMNDSYTARELNDSLQNRTFGYQNGRRIPFDQYDNVLGDKGIFSTTGDLLKWYRALKSEKIVSKELLREAYTPRSFEYPGLRNYGYGFRLWLNTKQQTDYVYHTGWWKGYNTIMFFDLREDFVIILLSNRYNRDVYFIKDIIEVLHGAEGSTTMEENILDE